MRSLTWPEVWQRRLARHHLTQPGASIPEVVRATCGIHAQVQSSAEVSIGLRTQGTTQRDVRMAVWQDRTLVRTYGLRGTVHLFAADDVATWLAALRAKAPPRPPNKHEEAALPAARVAEVVEAMRDALDGACLDRAALARALEERLGAWITHETYPGFDTYLPPWHLALAPAATAGVLGFGPSRGTAVTYVRLDQWLGPLPEIDGQRALHEVLKRFLRTYGPATPAEFARWFLTSGTCARRVFDEVGDALEEVEVEGWHAWQLRGDEAAQAQSSAHLLPYFDVYIVGGYPRDRLIPAAAPPIFRKTGTAAGFTVMLVDGVLGGCWKQTRHGKRLEIRVDPFVTLSSAQRDQLEAQAKRIGDILESPVDFAFDKVEPKGHW